jgi:hypothetical protein
MAKIDRLARLEARLSEMEREYSDTLVAALQATAAGKVGLFDHQGDRRVRLATAPTIDQLNALVEAIDKAREQLSMSEFTLHREFLAARGPVRSDAVGERKQAQAWLDRIASATPNVG